MFWFIAVAVVAALLGTAGATAWGTFRPNVYVGLRAAARDSPLVGLMWSSPLTGFSQLRHACRMEDGIVYSYLEHDGARHSVQELNDTALDLRLRVTFAAEADAKWTLRVEGTSLSGTARPETSTVSMMHYVVASERSTLEFDDEQRTILLGDGDALSAVPLSGTPDRLATQFLTLLPAEDKWRVDELAVQVAQAAGGQAELSNDERAGGNLAIVQQHLTLPFAFELRHDKLGRVPSTASASGESFAEKMRAAFPAIAPRHSGLAAQALSNMLGGIGFFEGDSLVAREPDEREPALSAHANAEEMDDIYGWEIVDASAPADAKAKAIVDRPRSQLLTTTPSRSFFPRGFLWDEGFHLLVFAPFAPQLALSILESWVATQDADGWIAREQILGAEARSRVPEQFRLQYRDYANPPTLFLPLLQLAERREAWGLDRDRLRAVAAKCAKWYRWFLETQQGQGDDDGGLSFRWRGRKGKHVLTSGFDDYPRPTPQSPDERHVDLLCWVSYMAKSLAAVSRVLGNEGDARMYTKTHAATVANLLKHHWNGRGFYDRGGNGELAEHDGYVTILPLALQLLPSDAPQVRVLLEMMGDESRLLSPHGLRSLSARDPFFGTDENYWRGNIWINVNFLVLRALKTQYMVEGAHMELAARLYGTLRERIIATVSDNWERTGFFWEQYNTQTGHGERTHPFTGWTSLVVNILAESY